MSTNRRRHRRRASDKSRRGNSTLELNRTSEAPRWLGWFGAGRVTPQRSSTRSARRRRAKARRDQRRRKHWFETLEERHLLTVTPTLLGSAATFTGDGADDTLLLRVNVSNQLEFSTDLGNNFSIDLDPITGGDQALTIGAGSIIAVDLGAGNDTLQLDSTLTTALSANSVVLSFEGGTDNDTLQGADVASTWSVTGRDSGSYGVGSPNTDVATFTSVESLTGGSDNDLFNIIDAGVIGDGGLLSRDLDGGAGTDTLDYSGFDHEISVSLSQSTASNVTNIANLESFVGGNSGYFTPGLTSAATSAVQPNERVQVGAEIYQYVDQNELASQSLAPLTTSTPTGINYEDPNLWRLATNNEFIAADTVNAWAISGADAGSLNATTSFSNFADLSGGRRADTFTFAAGGSISGQIDGGDSAYFDFTEQSEPEQVLVGERVIVVAGGVNTIYERLNSALTAPVGLTLDLAAEDYTGADWSAVAQAPDEVDLSALSGGTNFDLANSRVTVNSGEVIGSYRQIAKFTANSASGDSVSGPATQTTWEITAADTVTVNGVEFVDVETLTGSSADSDQFVFSGNTASITTLIDGGVGGRDSFAFRDGNDLEVVQLSGVTADQSGTAPNRLNIGDTITYANIDPIALTLDEIEGTSGDDQITLQVSGGNLQVGYAAANGGTVTFVPLSGNTYGTPVSSLTLPLAAGPDIKIDLMGGDDTVTIDANLTIPGKNLEIFAETIILNANRTIDTRTTSADAGSILFSGDTITLNENSQLLAQASPGFSAGDITLEVEESDFVAVQNRTPFALNTKEVKIDVKSGVEIRGDDVVFYAAARDRTLKSLASSIFSGNELESSSLINDYSIPFLPGADKLAGVPVKVLLRKSDAQIDVGAGVTIAGDGHVDIRTRATSDSSGKVSSKFFSVGYVQAEAISKVTFVGDTQNPTSITSGLSTVIRSDGKVKAKLGTKTSRDLGDAGATNLALSAAVSRGNLVSQVVVPAGVNVVSQRTANIKAEGETEVVAEAEAGLHSNGIAGLAFGVDISNADVKSEVNGNVTANQNPGAVVKWEFDPTLDGVIDNNRINLAIALDNDAAKNDTTTIPHDLPTGSAVEYSNRRGVGIGGSGNQLIGPEGQPLGGLVDGETYYVVRSPDDVDFIYLAESVGKARRAAEKLANGESLSTVPFVGDVVALPVSNQVALNEKVFNLDKVNQDTDEITLPNPGFQGEFGTNSFSLFGSTFELGQAVIYTVPMGGTAIGGLENGKIYYVNVPVTEAGINGDDRFVNKQVIKLSETENKALGGITLDLDLSTATGNDHKLAATHVLDSGLATGIGVLAELDVVTEVGSDAGLGSGKFDANPKTTGLKANVTKLQNKFAFADRIYDFTTGNATSDTRYQNVQQQLGSRPSFSLAGAFSVSVTDHQALALVGEMGSTSFDTIENASTTSSAQLKSKEDLEVVASISHQYQQVAGSNNEPQDSSDIKNTVYTAGGQQKSTAGSASLTLGIHDNQAKSVVQSGAQLDGYRATRVVTEVVYPFLTRPDEFIPGSWGELIDKLKSDGNPIDSFKDYIDGSAFTDLMNTYSRAFAKADGGGNALAGAVNIVILDDVAKSVVKSGALINQDDVFRGPDSNETFSVQAFNYKQQVHVTGVFDFPSILSALKGDRPSFGSKDASGGFGGVVFVNLIDITTHAIVETGTQIYTGYLGGMDVVAEEAFMNFSLSQSGSEADGFGLSGTGAVIIQDSDTRAEVQGGVTIVGADGGVLDTDIAGSPLTILANSLNTHINWAGALVRTNSKSFGITVAFNDIERDTNAILGTEDVTNATANTDTDVNTSGSVTVKANNDGAVWAFTAAAAIAGGSKAASSSGNEVPVGTQDGTKGKFGIGVSANVSWNQVDDTVNAYIFDSGSIIASAIDVIAENITDLFSLAFAASVTLPSTQAMMGGKLTATIAGSLSRNTLDGRTRAYVKGRTAQSRLKLLSSGPITVSAKRAGKITSISAGLGVEVSRNSPMEVGLAVAGSASINEIENDTEAFVTGIQDDTTIPSIPGTFSLLINSVDEAKIFAFAGGLSVALGGQNGSAGLSFAWNQIDGQNLARLDDSKLSRVSTLDVLADGKSDIDAISVAGSLAGGQGINIALAGTLSINEINVQTEALIGGTDTTVAASGDVRVLGTDISTIDADSGGFAIAASLGGKGASTAISVGAAVAINDIGQTREIFFNSSAANVVSVGGNTLTIPNHSLVTGQKVKYTAGNEDDNKAAIGGLAENKNYYVIRIDANTIRLASSEDNAVAGAAIDLTSLGGGTNHSLDARLGSLQTFILDSTSTTNVDVANDTITLPNHDMQTGQRVRYTAESKNFNPGAVDINTNAITIANHGWQNGQILTYSANAGSEINELTAGNNYYVAQRTNNSFKLATDAAGTNVLDLTTTGTGTQSFKAPIAIAPAGNILRENTDYYVIRQSNDTFKLALTEELAEAGTAIDITAVGGLSEDVITFFPDQHRTSAIIDDALVESATGAVIVQARSFGQKVLNFDPNQDVLERINFNPAATVSKQPVDVTVVDVITSQITLLNHGLETGDAITYSVGQDLEVGGLQDGTTYYAEVIDPDTIKLRTTMAGPTTVILTSAPSTPVQHTFEKQAPTVDTAENSIFLSNHGLKTGDAITYNNGTPTGQTGNIGGLTSNTEYFAIVVDANRIKLAANSNDATNNNAIPLSSSGASGRLHSFAQAATASGIRSLTMGGAAAVGLAGKGNFALSAAGAFSFNKIHRSVEALVRNTADVTAANSIIVDAEDRSKIEADAGGISLGIAGGTSFGAGLSIGAANSDNTIGNRVQAQIDNSVANSMGGSVNVTANSTADIDALTIAGSIAVGASKFGLALSGAGTGSYNTIANVIDASISGGADVDGQTVSVLAEDNSSINSDAGAVALALAIGKGAASVSVGLSISEADIDNDVRAAIEGTSTNVMADTGAVIVTAKSTAVIDTFTLGGALAIAGGNGLSAALSGAFSFNEINIDTDALIGTGASVFGINVGSTPGVQVLADDDANITALTLGASFGGTVGQGFAGALAVAASVSRNTIESDTLAHITGGTVGSASLASDVDVIVDANSNPQITATSVAASLAVGASLGAGVGVAGAGADSRNFILGSTQAYIDGGSNLSSNIDDVTVTATVPNTSNIDSLVVSVAAGVGVGKGGGGAVTIGVSLADNFVGYRDSSTKDAMLVHSYISGSSLNINGNLILDAQSNSDIEADVTTVSAALAAALGVSGAGAGAGARVRNFIATSTQAYISGGSVTVNGSAVQPISITSSDQSTIDADVNTVSVAANLALVGGSVAVAATESFNTVENTVASYAQNASVNATNGAIKIEATENATIDATAFTTAIAAAVSIGGAGAGSGTRAENTIRNSTSAYTNGGSVTARDNVDLSARETSQITADLPNFAVSAGIAALAGAVSITKNTINPNVSAYINGSVTSDTGDVTLTANSDAAASAETLTVAIAAGIGAAAAVVDAETTIGGTTQAYIGSFGNVTAADSSNGNVVLTANSRANATATVRAGAGSLLATAVVSDGSATTQNTTQAYVNGTVIARNLTATAEVLNNIASVDTTGGAGGFVAVTAPTSTASSTPTVNAYVGPGGNVNVVGDVTLQATGRGEADASAAAVTVGGIAVNSSKGKATVQPTVDAAVRSGGVVHANNVNVLADLASDGGQSAPSGQITAIDTANDTVNVAFPLIAGDTVEYSAFGPFPIGGLTPRPLIGEARQYNILDVTNGAIRFGNGLDASTDVNRATDIITFDRLHNFVSGDRVVYDPASGTNILGTTPANLFVRVVDDYRIRLVDSLDAATADESTLLAPVTDTNNNINRIFLPGNNLDPGQAVTYRSQSATFANEAVDVTVLPTFPNSSILRDSEGAAVHVDNDNLFLPNHGFATGDRVRYRGTGIGLTDDTNYFVIVISTSEIQLAATRSEAIDPVPTAIPLLTPTNDTDQHSLSRDMTGLRNGRTYYVVDRNADSIRLSLTPAGDALGIEYIANQHGAIGTHQIGTLGLDLNEGTGDQTLRIDLTSAPVNTIHQLVAEGGIPLETTITTNGDGVSSVTGKGGTGGIIASGTPDAIITLKPTVQARVDGTVTTVQDVSILANASTKTSAHADATSGGFVDNGSATATIGPNSNRDAAVTAATVGTSGVVDAGNNFTAIAQSEYVATATSKAKGGGAIVTKRSTSKTDLIDRPTVEIKDGGMVTAGNLATLVAGDATSTKKITTTADSNSRNGGFSFSTFARSNSDTDIDSEAKVRVGKVATLMAQHIDIHSYGHDTVPTSTARARANGVIATPNPTANRDLNLRANVEIDANVDAKLDSEKTWVRGDQGIDIQTTASTFGGSRNAIKENSLLGSERGDDTISQTEAVDAKLGAIVAAGPRAFGGAATPLFAGSGMTHLGLFVNNPGTTTWDADVVNLAAVPTAELIVSPDGTTTGLLGEYFSDPTLTTLADTRLDSAVNFDWALEAPTGITGLGTDNFSVRWTGTITPTTTGDHTFRTASDDGVRLWVDGQLLIDNFEASAATLTSAPITLNADEAYDIRLEYVEFDGAARVNLQWETPGAGSFVAVPTANLAAPRSGRVRDVEFTYDANTDTYTIDRVALPGADVAQIFFAGAGTLTKSADVIPKFRYQQAYDQLKIEIQDDANVVVNNISGGISGINNDGTVTQRPGDDVRILGPTLSDFVFDLVPDFQPPKSDKTATGKSPLFDLKANGPITINGDIDNPLGTTNIVTSTGDIISTGTIRTNELTVITPDGNIGSMTNRMNIELVVSQDECEPNGLTPTKMTAEAGQNIYADIRGLLRAVTTPPVTNLPINIDKVDAGGFVDLQLLEGLDQTTPPTPEPVFNFTVFDNGLLTTGIKNRYTPDDTTTINYPLGIFGTGNTPIETTYDFGLIEAGGGTVNPVQGNIDIFGVFSSGKINISGNTNTLPTTGQPEGNIDVSTNGDVTLTEIAGDMRVGLIQTVGTTPTFLSTGAAIIPIDLDGNSNSPILNELAPNILDGDSSTKYLNFGQENSGFIVTPTGGASVVHGFTITTANDRPDRDPASYQLFGTNDVITSTANSTGEAENWVLIDQGTLSLPEARQTTSSLVPVTNSASFTSYRVVFPELRSSPTDSMQIADMQLFGMPVKSDVSLTSSTGSIVDAIDSGDTATGDAEADVVGGSVTLVANSGAIGSSANRLQIDSSSPADGAVTASALNDIFITETAGDLRVNTITTNAFGSLTWLIADTGSILDANNNDSFNVSTWSVILNAPMGAIGEVANPFEIDSSDAFDVTAFAQDSIVVTETNGNFVVNEVRSEMGDAILRAANGSILDHASDSITDVTTLLGSVSLTATGTIGTSANPLEVETPASSNHTLGAMAGGSIYIIEQTSDLHLDQVNSTGGDVVLVSPSAILDPNADAAADVLGTSITLTAGPGHQIGTDAANPLEIDVRTGALTATAGQDIFITDTAGTFNIDLVASDRGDATLVALGGDMLEGGNDAAEDITANLITLTSNIGSIGSQANAIEINTPFNMGGAVTANAQDDINLTETIGDFLPIVIDSVSGNVTLTSLTGWIVDLDENHRISGESVTLNAPTGGIGVSNNPINVDTRNGGVSGTAEDDIFIDEVSFDLGVGALISTGGDVTLTAPGRIVEVGSDAAADVAGNNITLSAAVARDPGANVLVSNEVLGAGQSIQSANGEFTLSMQNDGNLVVYGPFNGTDTIYWASGTNGSGANRAILNPNGSLEMFDAGDNLDYSTSSGATTTVNPQLRLEDNGQVVIYRHDGQRVWESTLDNRSGGGTVLTPTADDGFIGLETNALEINTGSGNLRATAGDDFVSAATGQSIYLTETDGTLAVDDVIALANRVALTANNGSIVDAEFGDHADIQSSHVTLNAPAGGVGSAVNPLEIDADFLDATARDDLFIEESRNDLGIGLVLSTTGSVTLRNAYGSFFEFGEDAAADIVGTSITLDVQELGAIGDIEGPFEIDVRDAGSLTAIARLGAYLIDTAGNLNVNEVTSLTRDVLVGTTGASLLDANNTSAANVTGRSIMLEAGTGTIGTSGNRFDINTSNGPNHTLSAIAGGDIFITETDGDLDVFQVESTGGNVRLRTTGSTDGIYDGNPDVILPDPLQEPNVIGNSVALNAGLRIGLKSDPLDIDSSNSGSLVAVADGDIFITDLAGNLNISNVNSSTGDVRLVTNAGSILEFGNNIGADITARSLDLVASGSGASIGAEANDLEIDIADAGRLFATARLGVFLTETSGELNVLVATATGDDDGSIVGSTRITVQDSPALNTENLTLLEAGQDLSPEMRRHTGLLGGGVSTLVVSVGDDFTSQPGTLIAGSGNATTPAIVINADRVPNAADEADGAIVAINGELRGGGPVETFTIQINGGNQFDQFFIPASTFGRVIVTGHENPGIGTVTDNFLQVDGNGELPNNAQVTPDGSFDFEAVGDNENRNVTYENFNSVALADSNVGNNPPVNALPNMPLATPAGTNIRLYRNLVNRLGVIDPDAMSITLSLSLASGSNTLFLDTFGGVFASVVTGQGTSMMTLSGTLDEVSTDLFNLMFVPAAGFTGVDTLTVISDDTIATDTDSISVVVGDVSTPTVDLADPTNGGTINLATLNARDYVEVTFADDIALDFATINGDEVRISGPGLGTAQLTGVAQRQGVTPTYRFPFTGNFVAGQVAVDYIGGAFMDLAGTGNLNESESFTVIAGNTAPTIDSTPPATSIRAGDFYPYQVTATDGDTGDVLTYSLDTAPTGMTIHPETGMLQWVPRASQIGDHDVTIRVTDAAGLSGTQLFTLTIIDRNQPPTLTVDRFQNAMVEQLYTYTPTSGDVDGDPRTFSLVDAPTGMTINPTSGEIQWTPTAAQFGTELAVTVKASTPDGRFASDRIHFTVAPPPGDFQNDGDVDGFDFLEWQRGFGTTYDASDLATWRANYGQASPISTLSAPIVTAFQATEPVVAAAHVAEPLSATVEAARVAPSGEPDAITARDLALVLGLDDGSSDDPIAEVALADLVDRPWFANDGRGEYFSAVANSQEIPAVTNATDHDGGNNDPTEGEDTESPWLSDELLESIFE